MIIWEEALIDFGIAGIFIAYLIYDRQVLLKGIKVAMEHIAQELHWRNQNELYNHPTQSL